MISLFMTIVALFLFFKIALFIIRAAGKILGLLLCIIGWFILAGLVVSLLGIAFSMIPVLLGVGVAAVAAVKA